MAIFSALIASSLVYTRGLLETKMYLQLQPLPKNSTDILLRLSPAQPVAESSTVQSKSRRKVILKADPVFIPHLPRLSEERNRAQIIVWAETLWDLNLSLKTQPGSLKVILILISLLHLAAKQLL